MTNSKESTFLIIITNTIYWLIILIFLTIPLFVFLCYKLIVTAVVKILHSNWSSFDISDGMTLIDIPNIYTKPLFSTGFILKVKRSGKDLDINEFRQHFSKTLLEPINSRTGVPINQNLFCFVQTFGGLPFKEYLKLSDINIEELITEDQINEENFQDFLWNFYYAPYKLRKPMWNICILEINSSDSDNEFEDKTFSLLFRVHHSMADGYAFTYLFEQLATGEKLITEIGDDGIETFNDFKDSFIEKIKLIAVAPVKLVQWGKSMNSIPYPIKMTGVETKIHYIFFSLDLQTIKGISKESGTKVQSILLAILGGSVRKVLLEKNYVPNEEGLPEYVHSPFPLPWPHPKRKMCNEWSSGMFKVPIRINNPQERLLEIDKDYRSYHEKGLNKIFRRCITPIFSLLPVSLLKRATDSGDVPCAWSAMVAGAHYKLFGNEVTHIYPFGAMGSPKLSIGILSLSHSSKMDLTLGVNRELSPDGELAKQIANEYIPGELEKLKKIYLNC